LGEGYTTIYQGETCGRVGESIAFVEEEAPFAGIGVGCIPGVFGEFEAEPIHVAIGAEDMPTRFAPSGVVIAEGFAGGDGLARKVKGYIFEEHAAAGGGEEAEVLCGGHVVVVRFGAGIYAGRTHLEL
jgi:hypothetical protein